MLKYVFRISMITLTSLVPIYTAVAGTVTCEQGSEAVCDGFCTKAGGGMQSNPDGSTTCTYVMLKSQNIKGDIDKANGNDWLLIRFPDKTKK